MDLLTPTSGTRSCHRNLKVGYFSQHHVDQLDMSVSKIRLEPPFTEHIVHIKMEFLSSSEPLSTINPFFLYQNESF